MRFWELIDRWIYPQDQFVSFFENWKILETHSSKIKSRSIKNQIPNIYKLPRATETDARARIRRRVAQIQRKSAGIHAIAPATTADEARDSGKTGLNGKNGRMKFTFHPLFS
ncbi:MAG: hypothetical protein HZA25_01820 [Candidatus Niyogibacteria bacterium]|nr:hypothetical protein [Candidatus Niyogibacteria bacterium]